MNARKDYFAFIQRDDGYAVVTGDLSEGEMHVERVNDCASADEAMRKAFGKGAWQGALHVGFAIPCEDMYEQLIALTVEEKREVIYTVKTNPYLET